MKRTITIIVILLLLGAALPAKAAPVLMGSHETMRLQTEDATFRCLWLASESSPYDVCTLPDMSPFDVSSSFTNSGYDPHAWWAEAAIVCPPEDPTCFDDYGLYYYFEFTVTWSVVPPAIASPNVAVDIYNAYNGNPAYQYNRDELLECGSGSSASCTYIVSGYITDMRGGNTLHLAIGTTGGYTSITHTGHVYLSLFPIDGCANSFVAPEMETFEIDPTIELPLGPEGDPPDDQIYDTVIDSFYMIEIGGGPWNDGTTDHDDVAISWDGETWTELVQIQSECEGQAGGETGNNKFVFRATSETLYVRVNDTAGNFADNTNNPDPMTYTIGEAFESSQDCEDQYTYTEDDLIASIVVDGNDEDGEGIGLSDGVSLDFMSETYSIDELDDLFRNLFAEFEDVNSDIVGGWYAIKVTSGTWQDEAVAPDRTDMEFKFDSGPSSQKSGFDEDVSWIDFEGDEYGVGCQSTTGDAWFIQARNYVLHLRVNNEIGTFDTNTGSLNVSIYHATFERALEVCEFSYEGFGSPYRSEVAATANNGRLFANVPDGENPFSSVSGYAGSPDQDSSVINTGDGWSPVMLVPGAWYILETIDGPWWDGSGGMSRYDLAVNDGSDWLPLADWTVPACNVETDSLGHRKLYFQVPDGPLDWYLRVNDASFGDNSGIMAWNLYRGIERDSENPDYNPWQSCIDERGFQALAIMSPIPVKLEEGTFIKGSITASAGTPGGAEVPSKTNSALTLSVGYSYGIQINGGPWDDDDGDDVAGTHFDAAISNDGGVTWVPIDESIALGDCVSSDQQKEKFTFTFKVEDGEIWKIRVNDETGDFGNNGGNLSYTLWWLTDLDPNMIHGYAGGYTAEAVCSRPIMRPTSVIDVPAWINYVGAIIRRFFTICPPNIDSILAAIVALREKEPLASVNEAITQIDDMQIEIASYGWGDSTDLNKSIFSISSASELQSYLSSKFFPNTRHQAHSDPWNGDPLIDVDDFSGGWSPSSYYGVCLSAFDGYLPTKLAQGVCFASAAFRDTGASFWIQLAFDVSVIGLMIGMTKKPLQEVIYMMTGVKPWTKSGATSAMDKLISHMEGQSKNDRQQSDAAADELSRMLGGEFQRNRDGTYRRVR